MKEIEVDKSKEIKEIVLVNEDGTEEIIEKGMIAEYSCSEDGEVNLSVRFSNVEKKDVANILQGISILNEQAIKK